MIVTVKKLPKSRVELTIEVPAETMAIFFASAYAELAEQVDIAGFRKGKAPKLMVRDRVGEARLNAAATEHALARTYHEAVTKEGIVPIAEPEVHIKEIGEEKPFIYVAAVDVLPDVETGNYRNAHVKKQPFMPKSVTDKDIEEAVTHLRKAKAEPKKVLRPAQKGDLVETSYTGTIDGVPQEGLKNQNHPIVLGEGMVLPDFEKELLGMETGQKKTFTIEVPDRAGKKQPAEFSVTVESVAELTLPALDDELAKQFGKKTAEEVTKTLTDNLKAENEQNSRQGLEQAVIEAVTKQAKVELPDALIHREIDRRMEMLTEQLKLSGKNLNDWLRDQKKDSDSFHKELRPAAEESVKTGLVLRAIAENEGFIKPGEPAKTEDLEKTVKFLVETIAK